MTAHKRTDPFYYSRPWRLLRQAALERDSYRCVACRADVILPGAARIDHIKPRRDYPELALALGNLRTLCAACDNQSHREKGSGGRSGRAERFVIGGCDVDGNSTDPNHPWNR